MPQLQVVDFGPDPFAQHVSEQVRKFGENLTQYTRKGRNDEIFKRIKDKNGPDVSYDQIYKDVIDEQGLDEDYKTNYIAQIKGLVDLKHKVTDAEYKQMQLRLRQERQTERDQNNRNKTNKEKKKDDEKLAKDNKAASDAEKKRKNAIPSENLGYAKAFIKDSQELRSVVNLMNKLRENDPEITRDKAFEAAQQGIAKLQELEDNAKVPRPPIPGPIDKLNPFYKQDPEAFNKAFKEAVQKGRELYSQGLRDEKILRKIYTNNYWTTEQANEILNQVFPKNGILKGPAKNRPSLDEVLGGPSNSERPGLETIF